MRALIALFNFISANLPERTDVNEVIMIEVFDYRKSMGSDMIIIHWQLNRAVDTDFPTFNFRDGKLVPKDTDMQVARHCDIHNIPHTYFLPCPYSAERRRVQEQTIWQ